MLLTKIEVAERIRASSKTVARLAHRGELDGAIVGGKLLISSDSVDEYVARRFAEARADRQLAAA